MSELEEESELEMGTHSWDHPAQQMRVLAFNPYEKAILSFWPIFEITIITVTL